TSSPANGDLVFNSDGTFIFTPDEGYEGEVAFGYEIVDADGDTDPATVTINVTQPEIPEEPGPDLVLPEVIPQPVAALDFSKVTGLSHETMTLSFIVTNAAGDEVSEGHAIFYAEDNSGNRDFDWTIDSGETLDDGDYSVTFTRVTGDNAVIHNPVFFGSELLSDGSEVHHIHVHDPHNEGWTESFDFTLTEDVTVSDSVIIGSAADEDLAGTSADNIIFPGAGDDNISGGEGADTFVWNQGDTGEDTVYDFSLDESDRLNIADLLSDENVTAETIHDYVQAVSSGDDLVLTIDPAGDVLSGGEYEIILVGAADLESQSLVDLLNQLQGTEVL
ncbi:MAG: cadherin-like domain-containing protein, partial [Gammaproteobacteria bacterium]